MVVSLDCGDEAAQAAPLLGRKRFRGRYHENHGNKPSRLDSVVKSFGCRYTGMISPCFPFLSTASLRVVGPEGHTPLLHENEGGKWYVSQLQWKVREWKPLESGRDTHTHIYIHIYIYTYIYT